MLLVWSWAESGATTQSSSASTARIDLVCFIVLPVRKWDRLSRARAGRVLVRARRFGGRPSPPLVLCRRRRATAVPFQVVGCRAVASRRSSTKFPESDPARRRLVLPRGSAERHVRLEARPPLDHSPARTTWSATCIALVRSLRRQLKATRMRSSGSACASEATYHVGSGEVARHLMRTSAACEDEIVRTTATGESNVLPMLDRLTRWALGGGGDSPADLLAELAQRAGARAAMGLDLFLPDRTPRVVVRWQPDRLTPAQESALVRLAQRTDGDGAVAVSTLDGDLVGLLRRPRDSAFCLLLVAAAPGNDVEAALRLATRLFAHHYLREAASPPPTEETHGLVFAAGFVVGESL